MRDYYDYLIVGGGPAADGAARGIRSVDEHGSIGIVGDDVDPPYDRPKLSKDLWNDPEASFSDIWLDTEQATDAQVLTKTVVTAIDTRAHTVHSERGHAIGYGKLLLATGGHPRTVPSLPAGDRTIYFRTAADYRRLVDVAARRGHIAVVGASFIGTEIAASLSTAGCSVTLIFPNETIGDRAYPESVREQIEKSFSDHGVDLKRGVRVDGGSVGEQSVSLSLSDGAEVTADVVVLGLGIAPSVELAERAGIAVDDGIVVDSQLRTSADDVFAAGDVANYPDAILGRRRVEHIDNAGEMGQTAGANLAGSPNDYLHTPYFWSDIFDSGYEAVGDLDASKPMVEVDKPDGGKVVYYRDGDGIRGVLLWNLFGSTDDALAVMAEDSRLTDDDLRDRI
ncbi:NAD(P)/FAD-dependent oxidoreductase [Spelaeicoccus albus]|uniref:NADPH-dependent 2,4-dienoyl-CoA reductase/sulfur reductase-like enzyme n=1 Tax=Spelaeicoccus albus TaxID=1280376 RepID=A0A7Z0AA35_9MICO|nr:FAD-dependent oxidoreductase [Spelaeicoccus albus]NYI65863.1 NADPH-dependent 2,4-dienoyl-CoA reductase/sulfur reductase-like enzyme [Spelaeicoccus albus]